jgi:ubiquinone/menaquinone biosynthesis C-methylase UbiE
MIDKNAQFDGSIPANYDRFLGPVLFEPYAADLAVRLNLNKRATVLELACGTGILTKALSRSLSPNPRLVATDLNLPMLEYARAKIHDVPSISWMVADASALPFVSGSFDAVVCQFGLMFVRDKLTVMKAVHNVLRPDGVFVLNLWDALELNSFQRIADETVSRMFPMDAPGFYKVPFTLCDHKQIAALLRDGGFTHFELETVRKSAQSHSARDLAVGLVYGNPLISEIKERSVIGPEEVVDRLADAIVTECGSAPVGSMQAIVVTARS